MTKYIIIFITCSSGREARKIAKELLNEKLIACANIIEGVSSFFRWKGKVDMASESLMIIKTAKKNFAKVKQAVKELHSYEVPEIIALPIVEGEKKYLNWISESVKTSY